MSLILQAIGTLSDRLISLSVRLMKGCKKYRLLLFFAGMFATLLLQTLHKVLF